MTKAQKPESPPIIKDNFSQLSDKINLKGQGDYKIYFQNTSPQTRCLSNGKQRRKNTLYW